MFRKILEYIKAAVSHAWKFVLKYPIAIPITALLVILAIIGMFFGSTIQIGGILGKLWGKNKSKTKRATITEHRVDKDGNKILPGESDDKGYVQSPVKVNIRKPSIFSDPSEIIIDDPDEGEIVIPLPEGTSNTEIKEVVRISPDTYEVQNNDSGISVYKLEKLIDEMENSN